MPPTPDQIRKLLPESDQDSDIEFIDEAKAKENGLVETWAVQIGEYFLRVYKSLPIKKTIYIVLIVLSALEGTNFEIRILDKNEIPTIIKEYQDASQWTENVYKFQTPENQNRYFAFAYPPTPTPTDDTFFQLQMKVLAPITGSANVVQDKPYQVWNPNSGVA